MFKLRRVYNQRHPTNDKPQRSPLLPLIFPDGSRGPMPIGPIFIGLRERAIGSFHLSGMTDRLTLPDQRSRTMDTGAIKLDMLERLANVRDERIIKQMAALLRKAFPEVMAGEDDDISDAEYAAFQEELAKRDRGEIRFYSEEESIRMIRDGFQE